MNYDVILTPQAQKDLDGFHGRLLSRFEHQILSLSDDPRPRNCKKLIGRNSGWRIRIGDYRILYEIDEIRRVVNVCRIAHRREAYR